MTQTQYTTVIEEVREFLGSIKVSKANQELLMEKLDIFKPAATHRRLDRPDIIGDDGFIFEGWCKYHQQYEPAADLVISHRDILGKEKNRRECYAAAYRYKTLTQDMANLLQQSQDAIMAGDIEAAQSAARQAQFIKEHRSATPHEDGESLYNMAIDWGSYNAAKAAKAAKEDKEDEGGVD